MCRLVAYIGAPIFIETLLVHPKVSLIVQSLAAREAKTVVNADGCGVGWYGELPEPGVYRGILPAWSDANLASFCRQIKSSLFLAHVRSATSGEVSTANCHPFTAAQNLFMHNGQIGNYESVRRAVDALISDEFYPLRRGTSDSEAIFLAALGKGLNHDPKGAILGTLADIAKIMKATGNVAPFRFTAIHSDGENIHAFRWSSDNRPPSLYWRRMAGGIAVASEPFDSEGWCAVPASHVLSVGKDGVTQLEPIGF